MRYSLIAQLSAWPNSKNVIKFFQTLNSGSNIIRVIFLTRILIHKKCLLKFSIFLNILPICNFCSILTFVQHSVNQTNESKSTPLYESKTVNRKIVFSEVNFLKSTIFFVNIRKLLTIFQNVYSGIYTHTHTHTVSQYMMINYIVTQYSVLTSHIHNTLHFIIVQIKVGNLQPYKLSSAASMALSKDQLKLNTSTLNIASQKTF